MNQKAISHPVVVEPDESYFVGGVLAYGGVIGLQVFCNFQSVGFPGSLVPEYRFNGGAWTGMGTDQIQASDNYRAVVVEESGNYDFRFRNTGTDDATIQPGVIIRITHAE